MVNCVVVGCNNRSERGVRLYRFPNDPVRKKRWLVQVRRRDLTTANCKHNKLCEAHFETSQFAWTKTGKVRLSADAIPTIFTHPPVDKSWKETRKRRRRRRKMKDVGSHTSGPATSSANEDPEWDTQILKSRLQEEEGDLQQSQDHEVELCQTLRLQVEDLQKRLEEKDNKLNEANEVIRALRDEVQTLQQRLEQHRRSGDYSAGREGLLCWGARTNDLLTLVPVQPCVLTGTVPSDCRPSEPEPDSSYAGAGTSHKDQDVTSQNPPLRPPLGTSIGHRTETRTVLSDCRPNEPELGSSDAGASHKDQDVPSQDVGLITEPEPGSSDAGTSHKDQDITSQDITSQHPLETNTAIKTEDGEIPVFLSCTSEDDPADAPASPDDAELTSPREPNLPVSSVKLEDCSQLLNLPVPSLRLLDCREMVGPDGIFKVQIVEDPSDEGDHGDNQQDISHQDGDGEGPSPSHGSNDPSFAEPVGEQKKQSRDNKLKRKITQRLKGKTTQGLQRKTTQKVKGKTTQGLQRKTTQSQSLKSTRKFHNCRECEETFTFPSQLFIHQSMHAKESRATTAPHENTSTDSPNAGCLNTERYQVDHTYAKPYDENHNADTAHAGERPQLTGPTSTDAPTDSPKTLSHQEVDAILTPEPCTMPLLIQHLHSQSMPKRGRPVLVTDYSPHGNAPTDPTHKTTSIDSSDTGSHQKKVDDVSVTATPEPRNESHTAQRSCAPPQYYFTKFCVNATPEPGHENHSAHTVEGSHVSPQYFFTKFKLIKLPHSHQTPQHKQGVPDDERGPYQCDVCGKILNSKYSLTAHKQLNSDEKPHACKREKVTHQCDVCGKILSKKESLISHKRLHTGERPYACKQCDRAFRHHSNFMKHQITHSATRPRFECDVCGKQVLAKKSLIMHKSLHADTRHYACKHCDKTFALHALLKMHMKGHTGEKRHGCTQCGKAFAQAGHLRAHMRTHSQEKPHRCSVCDKAFSFRRGLKVHSRMHTGERPYSCSQCPRSFPTTGQRRKHEVSHSDEKPYLCLVCGQRYKTRQSLQTHEWLHTGEKPLSCTHCNKAFRFKYLLAEHIRIHTGEKPYQCSDCGERFHTVTRLKIHQAHHHEKVNSCHVCGKAYSSVYSLKVHQRVHTGERPYQCSICEERFRNPVPLQTHRRKVHNIDSNNSHQRVHTGAKQANVPSVGRNAPTQRLQPQQKKE
ncbi:zinc finger protein 62 homolog [Engraulis encrasicolus]|uniref:zinc finger protein 62 homolog n=1 Tax=Engraulis encrasicolus TaxID=184585 RepID=UPI002FD1914A